MVKFENLPSFVFGGYFVSLVESAEYNDALVDSLNEYANILRDTYGDKIALKRFVYRVAIDLFLSIRVSLKVDDDD